jgi:sulfide dehydrogenase [flavocytochrome c] flavoprotein subunit
MEEISSVSRRNLLKAGSAAFALSLMGGCASLGTGSAKPKVVVVGGGWGGLGAVRQLATSGQVDLTLIEPNTSFMSCPLSVLYIAGQAPASDFQRSYAVIDQLGVRQIRERVIEIDRANKAVKTATQRLPYDFLILSTGIEYMEDSLPGYAEGRDQLPVGFRAFEQMAVQAQVANFIENGGDYVITVPKPPYRCPPAPYERACLIAERMKQKGTKGKILLLDANPNPMPPPLAKPMMAAMKELYAGQIDYQTNVELKSVNAAKKIITTSKGDVGYRHANLILPMRAPGLIRQAGLGQRWADVKLPSFQSEADPNIFVIGDSQGQPLPKSGHVAFGAGQQVALQILATLAGTYKAPELGDMASLPAGICWGKVSTSSAIMINVTGSIEIGQPPKLSYQVDPAHNASSSKGAHEWGNQMWNSMLGT